VIGLALVFTPGVTVGHWRRAGLLERELRYYEELARCVGEVAFVSADPHDLPESAQIRVLSAPAALLARPRMVKTNQFAGLRVAAPARLLGARVVARGGYVPSEPWRHTAQVSRSRLLATLREMLLCRLADLVLVTTHAASKYLARRYGLPPHRIAVVPNFVDPERFALDRRPRAGTVTMVGRLTPEKNLLAAIDAISMVPGLTLRLVGDGPLREEVRRRAERRHVDVEMLGLVPHDQIPALLASTEIFLTASHFEGHPKALIEAMAAGVLCVVTDRPGLTELVPDAVRGYLAADTGPDAIAAALRRARTDPDGEMVAARAREWSVRSFGRAAVLEIECSAYRRAGLIS
jgi:glycosyltransferase involved in cell wall biosynthesis